MLLWRHITSNRNSFDRGTNESLVFFRKGWINLQFSANTMLSAAEFLPQTWFMRLWSFLHFISPCGLTAFHFCINLIKNVCCCSFVVVRLILSDVSRSVSPDTSPPRKFITSADRFFLLKCFFPLVFKNLKGDFILQQPLVFDWVPVRQSLYFFFSWMDSRFILSPSSLLCSLWSVFKPSRSSERRSPHKPVLRHTSRSRRCVFNEGRKRLFLKLYWSLTFESADPSVRSAAHSSTAMHFLTDCKKMR